MRRAIGDFSDTAADADIAIVYYAGHGIEVDGVNYLIPTDAKLARDFDVEDETISLDRVLRAIDSARRLRLVILDACRDNPFAQSMKRSSRAIGRGFARVEPTTPDTLVAFAAKAGSTASDGDGANSPFTAALLKHIATPGLDIRIALGQVRDEVMETTRPRQEPFVYGSLGGRVVSIVDAPVGSVAGPCGSGALTVSLTSRQAQPLSGAEECVLKPKDVFKECDTCPEMVVVPAGKFTMGSPKDEPERSEGEDQVSVTIARPFAVGRFAVTRGEFAAFVTESGYAMDGGCYTYTGSKPTLRPDRNWRSPGFPQNDRHPVTCVIWDDIRAYVSWLASKTGKIYRLLSEAEREFVARAGASTPFWWGSTISPQQANYGGVRKATVPVDTFLPNPWGLYNVHGNVFEWTEDCWNESNEGNPGNGEARLTGDCSFRIVRGGSWNNDPRFLRAAMRVWYRPVVRDSVAGFRVTRTL
jgi:formylglycine-generating enzyme required for sulfatase activity